MIHPCRGFDGSWTDVGFDTLHLTAAEEDTTWVLYAYHPRISFGVNKPSESYLSTEVSVCVMEMFPGDLPLILRLLESNKVAKCVFVLTNMFSQEQNVYFIASNRFSEISWVDQEGQFTSLIVIDAMAVSHTARETIQARLGEHAKL